MTKIFSVSLCRFFEKGSLWTCRETDYRKTEIETGRKKERNKKKKKE
jgi:hypothetical protein